ncbi:DUF2974 domain-containing protein, partial [Alloscardovia theropitheci]
MNIANVEYDDYTVYDAKRNHVVKYGPHRNKVLGTLDEVVDDESTGLRMYVVKTDDKHYSVLFRGSEAPGKAGWQKDWLDNDVPMADKILSGSKGVTPQLRQASQCLNRVMSEHKSASFEVYGHSLGSMNAQYAIANVREPSRIRGAFMYEGPNIYSTLNKQQRETVARLNSRAHDYVDSKDSIALGFSDFLGSVGLVHNVCSKDVHDVTKQHMWGGYQWNKDGSLIEGKPDVGEMKRVIDSYRRVRCASGMTPVKQFMLDYIQAEYMMSALVSDTCDMQRAIEREYEHMRACVEREIRSALAMMHTQLYALSDEEIESAIYQAGVSESQVWDR